MLSNKAAGSAAIAIAACVASGLTHAAAAVLQFYRPIDPWPAWIEIFAMAAFIVGMGAGIFAYTNAPAMPAGWRPAKPWTFNRLAPAAVYFGLVISSLALYKSTSPETSELVWKVGIGTMGQFAFALLAWENWWTWREFTSSVDIR